MRTCKTVVGISVAFALATVGVSACRDVTAPAKAAGPAPRLAVAATVVELERLYGPQQFARTRGATDEFTRNISTLRFEAPFVLHVRTLASDASRAPLAAVLSLDGKVLLSESDFARQAEWAIPVTPGQTAVLGVTLRGAPGSVIEVWMEGKRSDPVFCPNGPAGTYPTLPEALNAAVPDGTVLVCDGEHAIDRVSVQKPVTIRSQNPAGATLADADPNPQPQTGHPALLVDNVPLGRVRIADLNFLVRGRGIVAQGSFDQLEIDSVNFSGRDMITSYGVWINGSTVTSAKVGVTRSRFSALQVGVFAFGNVETNVRWSAFESFAPAGSHNGGAITYSGGLVNSVPFVSFGSAEHNTFRNCSVNGCIRVVGPTQAGNEITIANNDMTRLAGPSQVMAIFVGRAPSSTAPLGLVTVKDNDVAGVLGSGDPSVPPSWTVQSFVRTSGGPGGTPVAVINNRVNVVHTGIWAGTSVTARDNVLTDGYHAIAQRNPSVSVDFQRNDVIGFAASIFRIQLGGVVGSYRCNWWGSAAGPANAGPNVPASSYTPWATQRIAGRADVPCS